MNFKFKRLNFKFKPKIRNVFKQNIIDWELVIWSTLVVIVFIVFVSILIFNLVEMRKNNIENIQEKRIDAYRNLLKPKLFPLSINNSQLQRNRELYKLYLKGVPDKYDVNGNKLKGVEPQPKLAIQYAETVLKDRQHTDQDTVNLAKLFHYGMHKFEPNIDKAEAVYKHLQEHAKTRTGIQAAREGLKDIHDIRVRQWLNLPYTTHQPIQSDWQPVRPNRHGFGNRNNINRNQTNQITWDDYIVDFTDNLGDDLIFDPDIVDTAEHDDPHNTHNSQVLSTIRDSIKKLKKSTQIQNDEDTTINQIRTYINSLPQTSKTADALKSLNRVAQGNKALLNTGMSERETLNLVWNRILSYNSNQQKTSKENLLDELADMQEHGHTVCSTGRMDRLIDTLNTVDPEVNIKPTYAINEEMMTRAAKIREELLLQQPESIRNQLKAGTAPNQDAYDNQEKTTILQTLRKEYVEDNEIMTPEKFELETEKWIDYI